MPMEDAAQLTELVALSFPDTVDESRGKSVSFQFLVVKTFLLHRMAAYPDQTSRRKLRYLPI
jgi:hypothetical protein